MGESLKNKMQLIFSCLLSKRGLRFGAVFFFVFLGLVLPPQFAQAQGILGALFDIPVKIINFSLQVVLTISILVLALADLIFSWVISPWFTTLPYTFGGIVDVGWPIVRDFVNMFFIIALVIIGLSTALRIKEYQAQKALPRLIIIAILINFTPVICGLIIDATNILMNFFLEELSGFNLIKNFFYMQASVLQQIFTSFDFRYDVAALGKTIAMIIFIWGLPSFIWKEVNFWGLAYILFLYAFLFIYRYIMLWALVIVSPIAFFSKIFPGAQKHLFKSILGWEEWWKEFIEWSLMGVIAGFFLYLGEQLMMKAPAMFSGSQLAPGQGGIIGNPLVDFINNFLPWLVVLVFLQIAYKITKETSAMGAQGVIKSVDAALKTTAAAALTLGAAAAGTVGLMGKAAAGATRLEAGMGKVPIIGKPLKYGLGKPISWATRGIERAIVPPLEKYAAKTREVEIPEEFDRMSSSKQFTLAKSHLYAGTRLKYWARMSKLDTLKHEPEAQEMAAADAVALRKSPYYKKEVGDIMDDMPDKITKKMAIEYEVGEEAQEAMRTKIEKMEEQIRKQFSGEEITIQAAIKYNIDESKVTDELREEFVGDIAAGAVHTKELNSGDVGHIIKSHLKTLPTRIGSQDWSLSHLQTLRSSFDKETVENVLNQPGGLNAIIENQKDVEELYERNPRLVRAFLTTPAGREWAWKGMDYMPRTPDDKLDFDALEKAAEDIRKKREALKVLMERARAKIPVSPVKKKKIKKFGHTLH